MCGVYCVYTGYEALCYSCSQKDEDDSSSGYSFGSSSSKKCRDCGRAITIGERCYKCNSGLGPTTSSDGKCRKCGKPVAAPAKYCWSCSSF